MSQESRHMSHHFARNPWKKIWGNFTKRPCMCTPHVQMRQAWAFQLGHIGMNLVLVARQLWDENKGGVKFPPKIQGLLNLTWVFDWFFWFVFQVSASKDEKHRGVIMAWHDTHSVDSLWCAKGCLLDARREKPLEDVKQAILKVKPDIEVRSLLSVTGKNLPSFSRSQVDVFQQDLSQLNASRFSEMLEGRDVATLALWKDLWSIKDQIKCMEE